MSLPPSQESLNANQIALFVGTGGSNKKRITTATVSGLMRQFELLGEVEFGLRDAFEIQSVERGSITILAAILGGFVDSIAVADFVEKLFKRMKTPGSGIFEVLQKAVEEGAKEVRIVTSEKTYAVTSNEIVDAALFESSIIDYFYGPGQLGYRTNSDWDPIDDLRLVLTDAQSKLGQPLDGLETYDGKFVLGTGMRPIFVTGQRAMDVALQDYEGLPPLNKELRIYIKRFAPPEQADEVSFPKIGNIVFIEPT